MDIRSIFLFITAVIFANVGLYIYRKGPANFGRLSYGMHVFTVGVWAFGLGMFYYSRLSSFDIFWARFLYMAGSIVAATFLSFSATISSHTETVPKYKRILIFSPNIMLFILFFFTKFIVNDVKVINGAKGFVYGPGHILWDIVFDGQFILAILLLIKLFKRGTCTNITKMRIKYILLATSVTLVLAGTTNVAMPWFNRFELLWLGPGFAYLWLFCIIYAITRYRLIDINVAITRAAIFIVVYLIVLGIPFGIGVRSQQFLLERFGIRWWLIPSFAGVVMATLGPFLYLYLQRHAENTLLRDERRYQKIIYSASQEMILVKELGKLLELVVHILTKTVHITYAGIYLYDKEKESFVLSSHRGEKISLKAKEIEKDNPLIKCLSQTRKPTLLEEMKQHLHFANIEEKEMHRATSYMYGMNASLIIPTFIDNEIFTLLVLGDKQSGHIYTEDDLSTLSVLANQAALAIENAQFLKEREEIEARLRESEKLIATGEMLGSVKHEMGNLINKASTGMQVMTDLHLKGNEDKFNKLREKIVDNLTSAKIMWKYVDDYKTKSESDEMRLYKLEDMISAAISDSSELFEKWKIKLSLEISPKIALSGKASLPDIFKHLVINSCYGMELADPEEEGGRLSILANMNSGASEVEIIQADTGTDLTKDMKGRKLMGGELFAEQGKLGGISLFLARRVVFDHKGSFDIQSNDGKGTKFIIKLPVNFTTKA